MGRALGCSRRALLAAAGCGLVGLILSSCGIERRDVPQPAPPSTWNQSHRVDPAPGWVVTHRNVGPTDDSTSLIGPDGKGCLVSTWSSEPDAHTRPVRPSRVTVQGRRGSYGSLDPDFGPYPRAVIWRDATARWLRVSCDLNRAGILDVANLVHAQPTVMRVPFRLSAVPEGTSVVQLIESFDAGEHKAAVQFSTRGPLGDLTMQISNGLDVSLSHSDDRVEHRTVGGRRVDIRTASQTICIRTRSQPICIFGPAGEPATDWSPEARAMADRTVELVSPIADPDDDASWLSADEALPP